MILANGCSLTHGNLNAIEDNFLGETWPFQLGKHLNMDVTNIAMSGAGADYILKKTISWILKNGNPDMVLIGWPSAFRFEVPSQKRIARKYDGLTRYKDGTYNLNWKDSFRPAFGCKLETENRVHELDRFGGIIESEYLHFKFNMIDEKKNKYNFKLQQFSDRDKHLMWGKAIEEYDYTIFALWLAETKLYAMISLESFLKTRNIKYYWFDWCSTVTNEHTDGVIFWNGISSREGFNEDGKSRELSKEFSYKAHKESLSYDTKFIRAQCVSDAIGFWSSVNGYLPGWRWRERGKDKVKQDEIGNVKNGYMDAHYLLDWHEWFGKEFANFIKTGKNVFDKRDYGRMYDEYLKALEDPARHPPSNFLERIKKTEAYEGREVVIEDYHDNFVYD